MKKLFLTIILFSFLTFSQTEHPGELIITLINHGSSWDVTLKLSVFSVHWDESLELTDGYQFASINLNSNLNQTVAYFDHVLDGWSGGIPIFAFGLYKISAIENGVEQAYFYMDWRTSDVQPFGDVYFKYDVGNKRFRNNDDAQTIDKSYQTLWNILGQHGSTLETSGFEDYWDNCLAITNDENNHPRIIWGLYPDSDVSVQYYKIYKKKGTGNFSLLATTTDNLYVDEEESIPNPPVTSVPVYYKITAYGQLTEQNFESDYSNTVTINVSGGFDKKNSTENNVNPSEYSLSQNYPNPFNPVTTIQYVIASDKGTKQSVKLKVFDILGNEVATLVNEIKEAGYHKVEFNASEYNINSGVYLYKLTAGNYTETRKLILMK